MINFVLINTNSILILVARAQKHKMCVWAQFSNKIRIVAFHYFGEISQSIKTVSVSPLWNWICSWGQGSSPNTVKYRDDRSVGCNIEAVYESKYCKLVLHVLHYSFKPMQSQNIFEFPPYPCMLLINVKMGHKGESKSFHGEMRWFLYAIIWWPQFKKDWKLCSANTHLISVGVYR